MEMEMIMIVLGDSDEYHAIVVVFLALLF